MAHNAVDHSGTHHKKHPQQKANPIAFWISFGVVGVLFLLVIALFVMVLLGNKK